MVLDISGVGVGPCVDNRQSENTFADNTSGNVILSLGLEVSVRFGGFS